MNLSFIKLDINIMNDTKIKLIRKMPDGDSLLALWIGLMCQGMKSGRVGVVEIGDGIPFTEESLSIEFDINLNTVKLGLETFQRLKMIEIWETGEMFLLNFEKHQELSKIEKAKTVSRISSRKYRDKLKLLSDGHVTDGDEIDKEKIRKEKIRKEKREIAKKVIDYLNLKTGKKLKHGDNNLKPIIARINEEFSFDDFCKVVDIKITDKHFIESPQYLSPDTLFGTKFEKYLNSKVEIKPHQKTSPKPNKSFDELVQISIDLKNNEAKKRIIEKGKI